MRRSSSRARTREPRTPRAASCRSRTTLAAVGRCCSGRERLAGARVVQHGVPMGERPALRVLAREPDRDPLLEQRSRMRAPPHAPSRFRLRRERSRLRSSCFASFGLTSNPSGTREQLVFELEEPFGGHRGDDGRAGVRARRASAGGTGEAKLSGGRRGRSAARRGSPRASAPTRRASTTPSATSRCAYDSRTGGCCSMRSAWRGCVYAASSCSLCPNRR